MSFGVKRKEHLEEYLILPINHPPILLAPNDQDIVSGLFVDSSSIFCYCSPVDETLASVS